MEKFLNSVMIEARDLPEAWFKCIREVLLNGYIYTISRGGNVGTKRVEFDFVVIDIKNPGSRPLVPTDLPPTVPTPTSMDYVQGYLRYLMTGEKAPNEQYTYGEFLEGQIEKVIKMYKTGGFEQNQACMAVGDKYSIDLSDPPCLRMIDTRVRYGKLHFVVYFRSWDLFGGFPSNLAAIQLLKEYMASQIGVEDGQLIALSKGLHLYDSAWKWAEQYTGVKINNLGSS